MRAPWEITAYTADVAERKAGYRFGQLAVLGFLAGAFIAFAAEGSTMAAFNLFARPETYGLGRVLAGAVFGTGLMLVVVAGGELFTGNTLMFVGLLRRRITAKAMLRNWTIVYLANFAGALFLAWAMAHTGLFDSGAGMLGAVTVRIAAAKTAMGFLEAFLLGILCNWLVCLAIFMAYGAGTVEGKILSVFFPIWLFITSGFEHSVANMYYIPAGLFAVRDAGYTALADLAPELLLGLTWNGFLLGNLLPVTLGNIVGGAVFVGMAYWYTYHFEEERRTGWKSGTTG